MIRRTFETGRLPSSGLDGDGFGIFAQVYLNNGAKVFNEFQVNTTTAGDQLEPKVAAGSAGQFMVAWTGPGGSTRDVYTQAFKVPME